MATWECDDIMPSNSSEIGYTTPIEMDIGSNHQMSLFVSKPCTLLLKYHK